MKNLKKKSPPSPKNDEQSPENSVFVSIFTSIKASVDYTKENQDRFLDILEKHSDHIIKMDNRFFDVYQKDQESARDFLKSKMKYKFRGQNFAFATIILGFVFSGSVAWLFDLPEFSIVGVIAALGVIAAQFLGKKRKDGKNKG